MIRRISDSETASLVEVCLKSTYFSFQGEMDEKTHGAPMGSPLLPIIANLYMEYFEEMAISTTAHWLRFVDDTYFIWTHHREDLGPEHLS